MADSAASVPPLSCSCVDSSHLAMAIFGAISGTLLLCAGFALLIWFLARNDKFQLADKLLILERGLLRRQRHGQKRETEGDGELRSEMAPQHQIQMNGTEEVEHKANGQMMKKKEEVMELRREQQLDEREAEEKKEERMKADGKGEEPREEVPEEKKEEGMNGCGVANGNKMPDGTMEMCPNQQRGEEPISNGHHQQQQHMNPKRNGGQPEEGEAKSQDRFLSESQNFVELIPNGEDDERQQQQKQTTELKAALSAEQFGTLEMNRRRLEMERRQLRELGVI